MRFPCPICGEPTIGAVSKFFSRPAAPVKCSNCKNQVINSEWSRAFTQVFWTFGIWVLAILSFGYKSWVPLIAGCVTYIGVELLFLWMLPLRKITEKEIKVRRYALLAFVLLILGGILYEELF